MLIYQPNIQWSSKYTTLPTFTPSINSEFESNNTVPPFFAINDDAVTSPFACNIKLLDDISSNPSLPLMNDPLGLPKKNLLVRMSISRVLWLNIENNLKYLHIILNLRHYMELHL
jgi:hypothetical protein